MPDVAPGFLLHDVRVLEQDGGFSGETDVLVDQGVVTAVGSRSRRRPALPSTTSAASGSCQGCSTATPTSRCPR